MARLILALLLAQIALVITSSPLVRTSMAAGIANRPGHNVARTSVSAPWADMEVRATPGPAPYTPSLVGQVAGFRLAGIEPDGDPLYQTALQTRLSPSGGVPAAHMIVNSYLENFTPDTTPILPDLLHPGQTAQNLGGFLQGKALLTDDAGDVLYIGSFVAEAFLDNPHDGVGANHAVMRLYGPGQTYVGALKGVFHVHKDGTLSGALAGHLTLSAEARRQLIVHRGARMKPLRQIINVVTVRPHPMMGKATTGSSGVPLRTGFGSKLPSGQRTSAAPRTPGRKLSPLTIASGIGVIVSLTLAAYLFWSQRRTSPPAGTEEGSKG